MWIEPGNQGAVARWKIEFNHHVARVSTLKSPVSYILIYIIVHDLISLFRIHAFICVESLK